MRRPNSTLLVIAILSLTLIIGASLTTNKSPLTGLIHYVHFGPSNGLNIELNTFAVPNTNPRAQPDFDIFAWNSFIALSWPALIPNESNGFRRGIPDVTKSFAHARSNDTLVWETFKEKREVFNQALVDSSVVPPLTTDTLYPWNYQVDYGPLNASDLDKDPNAIVTHPESQRIFHQGKKQMTPFNAFDETTEVGSEVLEDTIYGGKTNPVLGRPVGPRVWRGPPSDSTPVLYEVKLNYDYYNYISENRLWTDDTIRIDSMADNALLRLPYRTSASTGPKGQIPGDKYQIATNYNSESTQKKYLNINYNNPPNTNPPLIGAMQFKVAWIELDLERDDTTKYHTSEAIYYNSDSSGNPYPIRGLFGMIGIHIIQRIHITSEDNLPDPAGGTFIFATWEHTSIRDSAKTVVTLNPMTNKLDTNLLTQYTYSNYYNPALDPGAECVQQGDSFVYKNKEQFYPVVDRSKPNDGVYPVPIVFDIIDNDDKSAQGTKQINDYVHSLLPAGSVWKNYQLVGTQFLAIDVNSASLAKEAGQKPRYPITELDPQGIGLPVYLANLVVETNQGLQKFQGQPPVTTPIDNYLGAGLTLNGTNDFQRDNSNTTFNRVAYNMGGCMGCHGVAQSKGFTFSFVLLGGRDGAATDTETLFESPPLGPVDNTCKEKE